jgi:hypothetical protein
MGILLVELTTQQVGTKRGEWRLPRAPEECSQVGGCADEWAAVGAALMWGF